MAPNCKHRRLRTFAPLRAGGRAVPTSDKRAQEEASSREKEVLLREDDELARSDRRQIFTCRRTGSTISACSRISGGVFPARIHKRGPATDHPFHLFRRAAAVTARPARLDFEPRKHPLELQVLCIKLFSH